MVRPFILIKEETTIMYQPRINCTSFKDGKCLHQAAPRALWGSASCIMERRSDDPRVILGCALITPHQEPTSVAPPKFI